MGYDKENDVDVASKYQVELNSKYTKRGSNSGENTKESILNIIRNQSNKTKERE